MDSDIVIKSMVKKTLTSLPVPQFNNTPLLAKIHHLKSHLSTHTEVL